VRVRRGIKALVGGVAVAVLVSACGPRITEGPPSCNAPSSPPAGVIADVFRAVNADRSRAGAPALRWNRQLFCLATEWSGAMASSGSLQHRDLNPVIQSSSYSSYRTLGENILRGPAGMTGAQMEAAWMNSPAHRANILSRSFTSIGIGYVISGSQVYATQNFGG
jgi:uncharacterized protein YkwD